MENNKIEFYKNQLNEKISGEFVSFNDLLKILYAMKENGLNQKSAFDILEEIRSSKKVQENKEIEDIFMGLMDIVSRYCIPQHYIW